MELYRGLTYPIAYRLVSSIKWRPMVNSRRMIFDRHLIFNFPLAKLYSNSLLVVRMVIFLNVCDPTDDIFRY